MTLEENIKLNSRKLPAIRNDLAPARIIPSIDIVFVTYHNESTISQLVESLFSQENVHVNLFCVDNSPDNATFSVIQTLLPHGWYYHDRSNPGPGASFNRAAQAGEGEWILFINPDAYFADKDDLYHLWESTRHLSDMSEKEHIILGPQLVYPNGTSYPTGRAFPSIITGSIHAIRTLFSSRGAEEYLHPPLVPLIANISAVDWVSGAAMFMSRKTFNTLTGFNHRYYMYAEDIDLCWRLRKIGGIVGRLETVQLIHLGAVSSGGGNSKTIRWHHISLMKFLLASTRGMQRLALPIVIPGLCVRYGLAMTKLWGKNMRERIRIQNFRKNA